MRSIVTTVVDVAAATCLVIGAALVYAPAAWIVAGLLLGAGSWSASQQSQPKPTQGEASS